VGITLPVVEVVRLDQAPGEAGVDLGRGGERHGHGGADELEVGLEPIFDEL
jgi:hypothetical protein